MSWFVKEIWQGSRQAQTPSRLEMQKRHAVHTTHLDQRGKAKVYLNSAICHHL